MTSKIWPLPEMHNPIRILINGVERDRVGEDYLKSSLTLIEKVNSLLTFSWKAMDALVFKNDRDVFTAVWNPGNLVRFPNSRIHVSDNGLELVTYDIANKESGRRRFKNGKDLYEFAGEKFDRTRAYYNSGFDIDNNVELMYQSYVILKNNLVLLETKSGSPLIPNRGSNGGELGGFVFFAPDFRKCSRYDIRKVKDDYFVLLLRDYLTIENEKKRFDVPILTIK